MHRNSFWWILICEIGRSLLMQNDQINKAIIQKLKAHRISRSISQSEMDERAVLPKATTCKIETERRELSASELVRMSRVLSLPLGAFTNESTIVYKEEAKVIEALRAIPFEDYKRILGMIETAVYYSSKDASDEHKDSLQDLVETLNQLGLSDNRPRTHLANVKRVRK